MVNFQYSIVTISNPNVTITIWKRAVLVAIKIGETFPELKNELIITLKEAKHWQPKQVDWIDKKLSFLEL